MRLEQRINALPSIKDEGGADCVSRAVVLELLTVSGTLFQVPLSDELTATVHVIAKAMRTTPEAIIAECVRERLEYPPAEQPKL
jgi:hypothetical protein